MVNYQLGKIYKIVDLSTDECYIGSTCQPTLAKRLAKHVQDYKRYCSGKGHLISSFNIVANDNYAIVLLEDFPCESKEELHKRERFYTRSSLTCVNKIKNQGLLAEVGKKEFRRLIDKEYYENNKENISERKNVYTSQNKDKIRERRRLYDETHKEQIKQSRTILNQCACGGRYQTINKIQHSKTKKHTSWLNRQIVCQDCEALA